MEVPSQDGPLACPRRLLENGVICCGPVPWCPRFQERMLFSVARGMMHPAPSHAAQEGVLPPVPCEREGMTVPIPRWLPEEMILSVPCHAAHEGLVSSVPCEQEEMSVPVADTLPV